MKKCPEGEYYCHDMKKCKPIPRGWHTTRLGWLVRDIDDENKKKNGNGKKSNGSSNGHGNGSNGNGMVVTSLAMVGVLTALMVEE